MRRAELWETFLIAADAARGAIDALQITPTAANRDRVDEALRTCMNRLAPLIGTDAAFRFEAALQQFREASHRVEHCQAVRAGIVLDDDDSARLRLLQEQRARAQRVFVEVASITLVRLNEVVERDKLLV